MEGNSLLGSPVCPMRGFFICPDFKSTKKIVLFRLAMASVLPSGEYLANVRGLLADQLFRSKPERASNRLTVPLRPPLATVTAFGAYATE